MCICDKVCVCMYVDMCVLICMFMYGLNSKTTDFFGIDEMELHQVFTQNNKSAYICMYV